MSSAYSIRLSLKISFGGKEAPSRVGKAFGVDFTDVKKSLHFTPLFAPPEKLSLQYKEALDLSPATLKISHPFSLQARTRMSNVLFLSEALFELLPSEFVFLRRESALGSCLLLDMHPCKEALDLLFFEAKPAE
jgi:hypothetical protein